MNERPHDVMSLRSIALAVLALAGVAGCVNTPRQNPFDAKNPGLKAEGRITGRVGIAGAISQANHVVSMVDNKGAVVDAPVTDDSGTFLSAPLPPGTYRVVLSVPSDNVATERSGVVVDPGVTVDVGLLVSTQLPLIGSLSGSVRLEQSAEPPSSVRILAQRVGATGSSISATSDANGDFVITGLASGDYMLIAERSGFTPDIVFASVAREAAPTRQAPISLALFPASAVVRFSVEGTLGSQIGARYTRSRDLDLLLLAFGGVTEMRLSEQQDFADVGEGWQRFSAEQPLQLSEGEGEKTLHAQFRRLDDAGKELLRSEIFSTTIILDTSPPAITLSIPGAQVTDSGVALQSDGSAVLTRVEAVDARSPIVGVRFLHDAADASLVPYETLTSEGLASLIDRVTALPGEGPHVARAQVIDAAGNASAIATLNLLLDQTAPTNVSVAIAGVSTFGSSSTLTRSSTVTVTIAANDAYEMRLGASSDLSNQAYLPFDAAARPFQLLPGDGSKTVFVEVRDRAGNASTAQASITLDTALPALPTVTVNDGVSSTRSTSVALLVSGLEPTGGVGLSGDILELGEYPTAGYPTSITLLNANGANTIVVTALDAAGNAAAPIASVVLGDTTAPPPGTVILAGGQSSVSSLIVPVSIRDTQAATMLFYEGDAVSCGADVACSDAGYVAFAPNTAFTLQPGALGPRRVCYRFCDEAGNATATASSVLSLSSYLDRPRPRLTSLSPSAFVALSAPTASLAITGRGIAADSIVRIGDFSFPCEATLADDDCRADAGGGCGVGGDCEATCGTTCEVSSLPNDILNNAGSYVVRLETPAPVEGGNGTSAEVAFFNVVSPVPTISRIFPRGVVQTLADDGTPVDQAPIVELWGSHFMSNAVFRLGNRVGEVLELREDPPGSTGRYARVQLSTAGLLPSDVSDASLSVINPSPGGGEASHPFGINPEVLVVPEFNNYASNLKRTRASNGMREQLQAFSGEVPFHNAISVLGGSYLEMRRASSQRLLGRFPVGVVAPILPGTERVVVTADASKVQSAIMVRSASEYNSTGGFVGNSNTFVAAGPQGGAVAVMKNGLGLGMILNRGADRITPIICVGAGVCSPSSTNYSTPQGPVSVAMGDLDGDLNPDVVVATQGVPRVSIRYGGANGTFGPRTDLNTDLLFNGTTLSTPTEVRLADLDGNGALDIVMLDANAFKHAFLVRYNNGSGGFVDYRFFDLPAGQYFEQLEVADFDRDGALDVLTVSENSHEIVLARGDGLGGFTAATRQYLALIDNVTKLQVADMNADGALDVVVASANTIAPERFPIYVLAGDGAGGFALVSTVSFVDGNVNSLAWSDDFSIADVSGDGFLDIVAIHDAYLLTYLGAGAAGFVDPEATTAIGDGNPKQQVPTGGPNRLNSVLLFPHLGMGNGTGLFLTKNLSNLVMQFDGVQQPVSTALATTTVSHRPNQLFAVDLDKDDDDDLVAADTTSNEVYTVRYSDGGYTPSMSPVPLPYATSNVVVHDVNGDGMSDLLSLGTYINFDGFQQNLGEAGPAFDTDLPRSYDTADDAALMAVADVTGDGRADVLVLNEQLDVQLFTYSTPGAGDLYFTAGATLDIAAADQARSFVVADVDLNGHPDLLVLTPSALHVRRMSATYGTFLATQTFTFSANNMDHLTVSDWNGDGIPDVAVGSYDSVYVRRGRVTPSWTLLAEDSFELTSADSIGAILARDVNGDGRVDLQAADYNRGTLQTRLNEGGMNFGTRYAQTIGPEPRDLAVVELGSDLVDEVMSASPSSKAVYGVQGNIARPFLSTLREMPAATLDIPAGTTTFGLGSGGVNSAMMKVDDVSVTVRIEGTSLEQLTLRLVSPSGQVVLLNDSAGCGPNWTGATLITAHYPTTSTCADFNTLDGWQPEGVWRLRVENPAGVTAVLRDFEVQVHGVYQQGTARGRTLASATPLRLLSGQQGVYVRSSTLGARDRGTLGCVDTQGVSQTSGPGERYFEFTLPAARTVSLDVLAAFDAAIELRAGACALAGAVYQCSDNPSPSHRNPRLVPESLGAGTYCVVVDGVDGGTFANSGAFEMSLRFDSPL